MECAFPEYISQKYLKSNKKARRVYKNYEAFIFFGWELTNPATGCYTFFTPADQSAGEFLPQNRGNPPKRGEFLTRRTLPCVPVTR